MSDNEKIINSIRTKFLVRERDYGRYKLPHEITPQSPDPIKTEHGFLSDGEIIQHIVGRKTIGLHPATFEKGCKWIGWDIDKHEGDENDPAENLRKALKLKRKLEAFGCFVVLEDSNDKGGYHIWLVFGSPIPIQRAYNFAQQVLKGIDPRIETFPKKGRLKPLGEKGQYGNWLRIPGKHHKSEYRSKFWVCENEWNSDINIWLDIPFTDPNLIPDFPDPDPLPANTKVKKERDNEEPEVDLYGWNWQADLYNFDIVKFFHNQGLLRANLGCGQFEVKCPWFEEHTAGDGGTCVYEKTETSWANFTCRHKHCEGRNTESLVYKYGQEIRKYCSKPAPAPETETIGEAKPVEDEPKPRLLRWSDLKRIAATQMDDWIITDLLETGTLNIFSGLPFCGKTTMVNFLLSCLATKRDFLGKTVISCPVIFVNADRTREKMMVKRIERSLPDPLDHLALEKILFVPDVPDMPDNINVVYIATLINEVTKIINVQTKKGLIVIDTLRSALMGDCEAGGENDTPTMVRLLKPFKKLVRESGWACIFLHHNNRGRDTYAGSAALAAMSDGLWTMRREEDSSVASLSIVTRNGIVPTIAVKETELGLEITTDDGTEDLQELSDKIGSEYLRVEDITKLFPKWAWSTLQGKLKNAVNNGYLIECRVKGKGNPKAYCSA